MDTWKLKTTGMGSYDVIVDGEKRGHVKVCPRYCGGGWMGKKVGGETRYGKTRRAIIEHILSR
jgi:hypothetical protein